MMMIMMFYALLLDTASSEPRSIEWDWKVLWLRTDERVKKSS
jgi:hypothetical protein